MGGIQSGKIATMAKIVGLGVKMAGFELCVVIPDKPENKPAKIIKRINMSMAEMQQRSCQPNIRDVYEVCRDIQESN
jgi:hypothetical protein